MRNAERAVSRERRSPFIALAVLLLVVVAAVLVGPRIARWRERESQLDLARERVAESLLVVSNQSHADSTTQRLEQQLAQLPQRVLRARSRSLAASALQSLVLELAESSNVTITRLDVAALESSGDLPFELSANGDIYGLADLLQRVRTSRFIVAVKKMQVQNNSALRGAPDVLQFTLSLAAPVIVE